jgi:Fur family ferric uptake transcriptional regulator
VHQDTHLDNQPFITVVHKEALIINELRKRGFKITNQRRIIIEMILKNKCSCCKEIYYQVLTKDTSIGIATVYRMVRLLEEMGVIDRKKLFQISYDNLIGVLADQIILIDEEKTTELVVEEWYDSLKKMLKEKGLIVDHEIAVIIKKSKPIESEEISYD